MYIASICPVSNQSLVFVATNVGSQEVTALSTPRINDLHFDVLSLIVSYLPRGGVPRVCRLWVEVCDSKRDGTFRSLIGLFSRCVLLHLPVSEPGEASCSSSSGVAEPSAPPHEEFLHREVVETSPDAHALPPGEILTAEAQFRGLLVTISELSVGELRGVLGYLTHKEREDASWTPLCDIARLFIGRMDTFTDSLPTDHRDSRERGYNLCAIQELFPAHTHELLAYIDWLLLSHGLHDEQRGWRAAIAGCEPLVLSADCTDLPSTIPQISLSDRERTCPRCRACMNENVGWSMDDALRVKDYGRLVSYYHSRKEEIDSRHSEQLQAVQDAFMNGITRGPDTLDLAIVVGYLEQLSGREGAMRAVIERLIEVGQQDQLVESLANRLKVRVGVGFIGPVWVVIANMVMDRCVDSLSGKKVIETLATGATPPREGWFRRLSCVVQTYNSRYPHDLFTEIDLALCILKNGGTRAAERVSGFLQVAKEYQWTLIEVCTFMAERGDAEEKAAFLSRSCVRKQRL